MVKSVLKRLTLQDLLKIKDSVVYDPTVPNGLRWLVKRKGRRASGIGRTFWIGQSSYQASHIVMILNGNWPADGDSVVTRIDKAGPWGDVRNLTWAPKGDAIAGGRDRNRQQLLRSVFGDAVPDLGDRLRLASLCKRGHQWNDYPVSLQFKDGTNWRCKECERQQESTPGAVAARRAWYEANREKLCREARERAAIRRADPTLAEVDRQRRLTPERAEQRRICKAKIRQSFKQQGLTSRGTERINAAPATGLQKAIRTAGRSPSVARLVMNEQLRHWRENPKDKAAHDRQWNRASWWLEYQTKPELRLYTREKSKRRKALIKNRTVIKISPKQLLQRFALFDNCCAYCGSTGDMQIEHAVPIAKGGTHAMGNILPACSSCNYSKRDKEIQSWYESQPFFLKSRWKKICRVLGWSNGAINQLALV